MVKMTATYLGELHCELEHGPSSTKIETDAPKDNMGRGEAFSPTDLIGASLASYILTTMAISADKEGIDLKGARIVVHKEMVTSPHRKIGRLQVDVALPKNLTEDRRKKYETIAITCPVYRSLNSDIKIEMSFNYSV